MAQLTETGRKHIARKNFAYVDKEDGEHLPIHDEEHVRNAIARFNQTAFESLDAKEKARRKVLAAAKRHDIGHHGVKTRRRPGPHPVQESQRLRRL